MARAYDFWDSFDRENFYPDGSMTEKYREWLMENGTSLFDTFGMEGRKMKEVKDFEEREQTFQQNWGISYTEWERSGQKLTPAQQQKRQQQALDSGEELSSLPYHMDSDEYYNYISDYPC